jgi:hypothetical protein
VSQVHKAFDEEGNALEPAYEKRVGKFLDEFEWYASALKCAREQEQCDQAAPGQQAMCRGQS